MPNTPGVIVNANARRARRDPALAERLERLLPGRVFRTTRSEQVPAALAALREAGVDVLVLVGGDGTAGGTLTPLLRSWPHEALPAVALARGGTINTIARSLGASGSPESVVEGLLDDEPPHVDTRRAVVKVSADGGDPVYGMIFVNGVGVRFLELYYGDSSLGVGGAASVVARLAGSAITRGALARRIFSPFQARVEVDGEEVALRSFTVTGASAVRHIGLGFQPFFDAGEDPECIHFTATDASALQILGELPGVRAGRARPGSRLRHHRAKQVVQRPAEPQPWSLDADLFAPAREIRISAGPVLRFVAP